MLVKGNTAIDGLFGKGKVSCGLTTSFPFGDEAAGDSMTSATN